MTDVLADRCAALAVVVVPLLRSAIEAQGAPAALDDVLTHIAGVRAVLQQGSAGAKADYVGWANVTPSILDGMEEAARAGDAATVWALFTDRANGFHRLGAICAGQPGW